MFETAVNTALIQIIFNVWNSGQHRFLYSKLFLMFETAVNTALIQSIISDNL